MYRRLGMTAIIQAFTAYLHHNKLTWGDLDTVQQYRAWVGFLVEWRGRAG